MKYLMLAVLVTVMGGIGSSSAEARERKAPLRRTVQEVAEELCTKTLNYSECGDWVAANIGAQTSYTMFSAANRICIGFNPSAKENNYAPFADQYQCYVRATKRIGDEDLTEDHLDCFHEKRFYDDKVKCIQQLYIRKDARNATGPSTGPAASSARQSDR